MSCGLCNQQAHELFYTQQRGPLMGRDYWRCRNCNLIQVSEQQRLSRNEEKAVYDLHNNDPNDQRYRDFLARVATPLQQQLTPGAQGLDFGAGPGPTLSLMMTAAGFPCTTYDIYYAPYPERLQARYDYITCTEVIEHLGQPAQVIQTLLSCLAPGGYLALMTKRWTDLEHFKGWSYRNDPTHISFFHRHSFDWLAKHWQLDIIYTSADVVILRVPS
ncbi:class I SAM-dependent methyltransferase [Pseudidiomarina sp. E22-M8]|uniref:class I SAM-dependent methyltransferase n=1 Tax=Pseudidiomarina sp. E22-M8 TaxID=3424768 RepID=UPI00403C7A4C